MKRSALLVLVLASSLTSIAQFNFSRIHNQQMHNMASADLPSLLGDDIRTAEIFLPSIYAGFANNMISAGLLREFTNPNSSIDSLADRYVRDFPKTGTVWAGADIPVFSVFFNVNKKGREPFLSFGMGVRTRADLNLNLDKNLISLLYNGNKQFAGETVNLAPSINLLATNETFLAVALRIKPFQIDSKHVITVKPAIRLRRISGLANINMINSSLDMYTDPNGEFIRFNSVLQANMATIGDTPSVSGFGENLDMSNMLKAPGRGLGIDVGVGVKLNKNIQAHVGIVDIGSIHFKRNVANYSSKGEIVYDGVDLNNPEESFSTAKLEDLLDPEITHNAYKTPLPTRLVMSGSYLMKEKTRRGVTYFKHNVTAIYVQGFRNYLSTTSTPALNVGYSYNLANMVNTGLHMTVGGLNGFMTGAHLGFRLGAVKFGFASNNMFPILYKQGGRGTDLNLWFGFYF